MWKAFSEQISEQVEAVEKSLARFRRKQHSGTAMACSEDGLFVTVAHLLEGRDHVELEDSSGGRSRAQVVGLDHATDLALLRAEGLSCKPVRWAQAEGLRVGQVVLTVGMPPNGLRVSLGLIGQLGGSWRTQMGASVDRWIDVDGSLPMGCSGGPLVSLEGEVVGLNTHGLTRSGTTISAATVQRVIASMLSEGDTPRGYLGVAVQPVRLPTRLAQKAQQEVGLLVISISDESPAEQGGLELGDVLLRIDEKPVAQFADLLGILAHAGGQWMRFALLRAGGLEEKQVEIGVKGSE